MWAIKFLNGPRAGDIVDLKPGVNRVGRGVDNDIQLTTPGVSKVHLEFMITNDKVLVNDLQSSNGTYVNGVRIKGTLVHPGDKISVHQLLMELVIASAQPRKKRPALKAPSPNALVAMPQNQVSDPGSNLPAFYGNEEYSPESAFSSAPVAAAPPQDLAGRVQGAVNKTNSFIDNVALPGVYRLPQIFDFKQVIMGFIAIYIVLVTLLSVIPMKQITSESIQNESLRRALTVARSLASANEKIIRSNDLSSFSTDMVLREEGISDVYIVSREGTILAPPERTGASPREVGFVRKIRGQPREFSEGISDGQIAAAVPILIFDPELQQNTAKAHAVVVYNPGSLAFDDGRAFSLFIQMLFLAFIAGGILFFFLYRLIEYPFKLLNNELDLALREGRDQAQISFNFPVLQNLLTNVNSLLARAAAGATAAPSVGKGARDQEIFNLMQLMGYPCLLVSSDQRIIKVSPSFGELMGFSVNQLEGQSVGGIPDTAMQQNFVSLMAQSEANSSQIIHDHLELSGHLFSLHCQAIAGGSGDIEYYLISITPASDAQGGAA